eukprot:PhM_4_TR10445/c0_g1_i1/m.96313
MTRHHYNNYHAHEHVGKPFHTVPRSQAPPWSLQDYPYIQRGFIAPGYPQWQCIYSFFTATNETTNVWSQVIGMSLFLYCFLSTYDESDGENGTLFTDVNSNEMWWLRVCLCADLVVCTASTVCHLLQSNSRIHHDVLAVGDWGSILLVALAAGGALDMTEACPQYFPGTAHFSTSLLLAFAYCRFLGKKGVEGTSHAERFGGMAVVVVYACGVPALAQGYYHWDTVFMWFVVGVAGFLVGGFFFASHLPEKAVPSKLDICLSSHTLWHIGYQIGLYHLNCALAYLLLHRVPWQ